MPRSNLETSKMLKKLALLSASVLVQALDVAAGSGPTVVIPNLGRVEGLDSAPSGQLLLAEFRGIPYAQPPIGDLRWQPPKAHEGWGDATLNATAYGSECSQTDRTESKEDCLYLNIVAPKHVLNDGAKKLPVMIWIHGGGLLQDGGDRYRLANMVASSNGTFVLMAMNYRLGAFGFLGGADLMARTDGAGAGNFGIQDQRAAVAWAKANIGAFGGDGNEITIFGESAGGQCVLHHLVQPASFSLYKKAIIESGVMYPKIAETMADAEDFYKKFLNATSCTNLACLVALDAKVLLNKSTTLIEATRTGQFFPVIDGVSLTDHPYNLVAANHFNKVPVIIGGNREEEAGTVSAVNTPQNMTEEEFDATAADPDSYFNLSLTPATLADMKRVYNPEVYQYPAYRGNYSIWYWMYVRYLSDKIPEKGGCGARWFARMLVAGGSPAVYLYLFAHPPAWLGGVFSMHTGELPFVFDYFLSNTSEGKLAHSMARYWYSFAISTSAVPSGEVSWPKVTPEGDNVLVLDVESAGGIRAEKVLARDAACKWQLEQAQARGGPGLSGTSGFIKSVSPLPSADLSRLRR